MAAPQVPKRAVTAAAVGWLSVASAQSRAVCGAVRLVVSRFETVARCDLSPCVGGSGRGRACARSGVVAAARPLGSAVALGGAGRRGPGRVDRGFRALSRPGPGSGFSVAGVSASTLVHLARGRRSSRGMCLGRATAEVLLFRFPLVAGARPAEWALDLGGTGRRRPVCWHGPGRAAG